MPDKGEEINKAQIKMLKGRMRMNTEYYKNKWREAKKMYWPRKKNHVALRCWKVWREQINEAKKFYTVAHGMKHDFQPWMSVCKFRDGNFIGNDWLIMERWKQYFYETLNIHDDVEIRVEVIYQRPEEQIEPPTKDEVWEIIKTLKNNK